MDVRSRVRSGRWAWVLAAAAIGGPVLWAGLLALSGDHPDRLLLSTVNAPVEAAWRRHALVWDASRNVAQPWRWWGAAWVHLNATHRWINAVGWFAVLVFGLAARVPARGALAWLLAWPLTHAVLMAVPGLRFYAGLSGVLHAGVAVACVCLLTRPHRSRTDTVVGASVLLGLCIKIALEQPWAVVSRSEPVWGLAVVPAAHAAGCLAGLVCALLIARRP